MKAAFLSAGIVLGACFAVCIAGGARNHQALLNSDSYSYLCFARALAAGSLYQDYDLYRLFADRVPPGRTINLHYGTRNYRDGAVYSGLPVGFPLLLALAIRLGGVPAAFGVNVAMLVLFLGAFFLAAREILRSDPDGEGIALTATALALALDGRIIFRFALMPMRDLPSLALFWAGLALLLLSVRSRPAAPGPLLAAFAVFGASCTIRLTNGLAFLPLLAFVLARGAFGGPRRTALILVSGAALFALIFSPEMIENYRFNRNPFAPFLHALTNSPSTGESLFSADYFFRHLPSNLSQLAAILRPGGLALILLGVAARRRSLSLWLILVGIPVLHVLFFSFFEQDYPRYLMPVLPFLSLLLVAGAASALRAVEGRVAPRPGPRLAAAALGLALGAYYLRLLSAPPSPGWRNALVPLAASWLLLLALPLRAPPSLRRSLAASAAALAVIAELLVWIVQSDHFGWREAAAFRDRIESAAPPGSVVFGTRYLVQNIDFYTRARAIDPVQLCGPFDLSLAEVAGRIIGAGRPLFVIDNKGVKSAARYVRELGRIFDLEAAARWRSADLKLDRRGYSGNEFLTLYRVVPWSAAPQEAWVDTPERTDYLALLDLKGLDPAAAAAVRVRAGAVPLDLRLQPGLNFLHIPAAAVAVPRTALWLDSPAPITSRGWLGSRPVREGLVLPVGKGREIPDSLFLEKGFRSGRSGSYRLLRSRGSIRIPVVRLPGCRPVARLKVKNASSAGAPLLLRLSLEGAVPAEVSIPAGPGWQSVDYPFPDGVPAASAATLALTVARAGGARGSPALALSEIRLEQVEAGGGLSPGGD